MTLVGGQGDDLLNIGGLATNVRGHLDGGEGNDTLRGGPGTDTLDGGPGPDGFFGGGGMFDMVTYASRTAPITADIDGGVVDDGEAGERDSIMVDVEIIVGGAGDDDLKTNQELVPGVTYGLQGGGGKDTLTGGPNPDELYAGSSKDHLHGGAGNDRLHGSSEGGKAYLHGEAGNDELFAGSNGTTLMYGGPGPSGADTDSDTFHGAGQETSFSQLSYRTRTRPVQLSFDGAANDGDTAAGEHDNVGATIDSVLGGSGNDWLVDYASAAHPHVLDGGPGSDTLFLRDFTPGDEAIGGEDPGNTDVDNCPFDSGDTFRECESWVG